MNNLFIVYKWYVLMDRLHTQRSHPLPAAAGSHGEMFTTCPHPGTYSVPLVPQLLNSFTQSFQPHPLGE